MKPRKMLSVALMFLSMTSSAIVLAVSGDSDVSAQCPPTNDPDPTAWAIFLPNPVDCGSYYVCNWGEAILMPCPAGLHFNATLNVCDWVHSAGCTVSK